MAVICPQCGLQYDAALFTFDRQIRCGCGAWIDLARGHTRSAVPEATNDPQGCAALRRFQLSSPAFAHAERIPAKYTDDGPNVSPPLCWEGVPENACELALICEDPDAPTADPWVHWIVYKIAPSVCFLPEDLPPLARLERPVEVFQGRNSWHSGRTIGYRGPAPPRRDRPHRYFFRLFAFQSPLRVNPGIDRATFLAASAPHVVAETVLVGTYAR